MLGQKSVIGRGSGASKLTSSPRSNAIHLGDMSDTVAGHWIIVSDIASGKLQFWYGSYLPDDEDISAISSGKAKLAFEINKPA